MKYLLAVDGGGTKTEFCVSDREGNIIGSCLTESTNFKSVGIDICRDNIRAGTKHIKEHLGIEISDLAYGVFGISGCDSPEDKKIISEMLCRIGFDKEHFYLCNDSLLAYYAQAEEPGIVVISGTGSIILGIDRNRNMRRVGGWGYNISDVGSGYWLGNETARHTLLYCDGCEEYSELFEAVREKFGAGDFNSLPYKITECLSYQEIAGLSQILIRQYDLGIQKAAEIVKHGIGELAHMAAHVYEQLDFCREEEICLVLSGGVMSNKSVQDLFRQLFTEKIHKNNIELRIQQNQPAYGGLKLAEHILEGNGFYE